MKRRLIITGLLLLVFASGGLVWLGGTEAGLKWVYGQATQRIPGKLQVSSLSGRLIGPIEITDIRYRLENQSVEIRQASFDWNLRELTGGELEIEQVYLEGMQVEISQPEVSPDHASSEITIPEIALPVVIDLQDFEIEDLRIIRGDQTTLLERLHTRLLLDRQQLRIESLDLESEQLQLNLSGKLEPSPALPHEIDLNWRARLSPAETLQGKGRLSGNLSRTRLTQSIAGAIQLELDLLLENLLTQTGWQAEVDLTRIDTRRINDTLPPVTGSLRLSAQGDLKSATASGQLALEQSPYGALTTDFNLERVALTENADGIEVSQLRLALLQGDIETSGSFLWLPEPRWQAELELTGFDTRQFNNTLPVLAGSFQISAQGNMTSATARGHLALEESPYGSLTTRFNLDRVALTETGDGIQVSQLRLTLLQGEIQTSGSFLWQPEPSWQAQVSARAINPSQIQPDWPGHIDAELNLTGTILGDNLELSLDIEQLEGELRHYPVSMQGKLDWKNNLAHINNLRLASKNTSLTLNGKVAQQLDVTWSLQSTDLDELYPAASGKLNAKGRLGGTQEQPLVKAQLSGNRISVSDFAAEDIDANIDLELNLYQPNQIPAKKIKLDVTGQQIHWRDMIFDRIELNADEQGLKSLIEAPQGKVEIELTGVMETDGWRGHLTSAKLHTRDYHNWQLQAPATLELLAGQSSLDALCLQSTKAGEICASIRHRGSDAEIDLDLQGIPLQLLQAWIPPEMDIDSRANASARLKYKPQQLLGEAEVELLPGLVKYTLAPQQQQNIVFEGARINALLSESGIDTSLEFNLDNGDGIRGSASLPAANLLGFDADSQALTASFELRLRQLGLIDAMLRDVENLHGSLSANLEIEGRLKQPQLSGKARLENSSLFIPGLNLDISELNIDALSKEFEQVDYRAQARIAEGSISLDGKTRLEAAAGWPSVINMNGENLELGRLLRPYLPESLFVDGKLSTNASLSLKSGGQLQARLKLTSSRGLLSYNLSEDETSRWDYRDVSLDVEVDERGLIAQANLNIGENQLKAALNLPQAELLKLDLKTQKLDGSLNILSKDFAMLEALLPDLQQPQGELQLNMDLSGTMAQPRILGQADLKLDSLKIPRLGINPRQVELHLESDHTGLFKFNGRADSGDGTLNLSGSGQLDSSRGWPVTVKINGEDFEAMRTPEAIVNLSPELAVSLAHKTINVQGQVSIPYARLRPVDVGSAARISSDTVILGEDQKTQSNWQISSDVRVLLGDRVSLFAYGFDGRLGGNMVIEEKPGQPTRGTGEIKIIEGRYRAYGQHLDIEQGRLLFTGGPLNNPGLDVQAVRKTPEVIAGVKITGRLQQPRLDLFSTPSLGQTDILSYLLTGGPLESASSGQGAMLANASLALGLSGGDQIARSIGDRFGFDEMRVESDSSGDQASLVVGRYLSPRLYVGYGIGLIESINTFNLRYRISDHWQLEAESGVDQGADLFYRFER